MKLDRSESIPKDSEGIISAAKSAPIANVVWILVIRLDGGVGSSLTRFHASVGVPELLYIISNVGFLLQVGSDTAFLVTDYFDAGNPTLCGKESVA